MQNLEPSALLNKVAISLSIRWHVIGVWRLNEHMTTTINFSCAVRIPSLNLLLPLHQASKQTPFHKILFLSQNAKRKQTYFENSFAMFKATARSLYQLIGKTRLGDLPPEWQAPVGQVLDAEEKSDPRFKNAEIRGSKPHASHDDPTDPKDVVSVRIKDDGLKTFRRLHIHQDGSVKRIDV